MNTTTTNSNMTNSTSKCPDFLESPPNMTTFSFCALGSCGNNTAIMSLCCNGAQIVPYHYDSGFPGLQNETSGNASWCRVSNEPSLAWSNCVSSYGGQGGMCSFSKENSAGRMSSELGGMTGLIGLVVLMYAML
ncbi:hypothetical protein KCU64_g7169, partial [Aureobasidium melanogenum]